MCAICAICAMCAAKQIVIMNRICNMNQDMYVICVTDQIAMMIVNTINGVVMELNLKSTGVDGRNVMVIVVFSGVDALIFVASVLTGENNAYRIQKFKKFKKLKFYFP